MCTFKISCHVQVQLVPIHNLRNLYHTMWINFLVLCVINCYFTNGYRQHHGIRHHREHVREFSCGKLYYRTFHLDPRRDVLYVGAMDKIFRLDLVNVNRTNCEIDSVSLEPTSVSNCVSKGKSEHYDCRNHIRVIQPIGDGNRLYVCGTNAHYPKDWVINSNLSRSHSQETFPGIGSGIAKCPFDPEDNVTAVWVENGNPGNLPGLYSGTVADFTKADSVIFRTELFNLTTRQSVHPFKRTIKYDSKWLDKPNFVGSFDIGDNVYFFFRESAVEYINCGKNIYSRVARVCKKDNGGRSILNKNWATFMKARLNCSIPGEFPFYFNEIQHIYKHPDDNSKFYAVFSTSLNGLIGSAICTFTLDSIQEVFNGKFKEQSNSMSAWLPVLSSKVPEPRPGVCVDDTQSLPDSVLNFIRGHPLMDSTVTHDNGKPVFYKRDTVFTRIVVDKLQVDGIQYLIYYAGTSTGEVYKLVQWTDRMGEVHSNLVDVFEATSPHPVRAMEIFPKYKSLYVSSDFNIKQFHLSMCKQRHDNCLGCIRDPYCGWDKDHNECKPYVIGFMQDVTNSTPSVCDASVGFKDQKVFWGQSVHLTCTGRYQDIEPLISESGPIKWFHSRNERSTPFEVFPRRDKFIVTNDNGLVILGVTDRESGRYECKLGSNTLSRHNITVDAKTCTAMNEAEYRKIYSDWCHEFEKYKNTMKSWQAKQKCAQRVKSCRDKCDGQDFQ
ncbi:semaphorin-2A [Tetranychus urticae]|uniref:semaphorin-2A n=1 Tax=Tetranychus urticae TaxID=32264 RepID=UPI00077BA5A0|nr:semaphorin-2A [Tetranychus urticae]